MTGDESEAGPRSLSSESGTGFSRVPGRRGAGNDIRSRRTGSITTTENWTSERADESTTGGRVVLYAVLAAVAAVLLATGANEVLTAAANFDLAALVRGDPRLLMEADAALARASAAASRAAFLTRVIAAAVIAWVGLRVAVRWWA